MKTYVKLPLMGLMILLGWVQTSQAANECKSAPVTCHIGITGYLGRPEIVFLEYATPDSGKELLHYSYDQEGINRMRRKAQELMDKGNCNSIADETVQ